MGSGTSLRGMVDYIKFQKQNKKNEPIKVMIVIPKNSELYEYCYTKHGIIRPREKAIELLKKAPERIKELAIRKHIAVKSELEEKTVEVNNG